MRPPILILTAAFGVGLWAGLDPFAFPGVALWGVALPLLAAAAWLAPRAPLGAAVGIMGVAGMLWGTAAVRERDATCAGTWSRERGPGSSRAAIVSLEDPAPVSGGIVDADVLSGTCHGSVRLRWPEGTGARGGTTWVVAGKWSGLDRGGGMGLLVVRRMRALDLVPRGRGALRDALAARSTELFGARAPIVNALVFAPNTRLDSDIRERYVRSGLAHLLSISGLHVGFIAAWLALILGKLPLAARARFGATAVLLLGYLWLLGFPAPAVRAERCWPWRRWRACASAWSRRAASWRSRLWVSCSRTRGHSSPWVRGCRSRVWARWSGRAARSPGHRASRGSPRPHSPPRSLPRRSVRSRSAPWRRSACSRTSSRSPLPASRYRVSSSRWCCRGSDRGSRT